MKDPRKKNDDTKKDGVCINFKKKKKITMEKMLVTCQ